MMGMMINRRRVCGGKSGPYDAEIEYLEYEPAHTFTINTGVVYSEGIGFGCEISHFETIVANVDSANGYNRLIGCYAAFPNKAAFYVCPTNFIRANEVGSVTCDFKDRTYNLNTKISGTNKQKIEIKPYSSSALRIYINNVNKNEVDSFIPAVKETIRFLENAFSLYYKGRVYRIFVYDTDGTYLFDAIPVRIGQTGYMYDKVSGQLFGNSGTGNFILGPDV